MGPGPWPGARPLIASPSSVGQLEPVAHRMCSALRAHRPQAASGGPARSGEGTGQVWTAGGVGSPPSGSHQMSGVDRTPKRGGGPGGPAPEGRAAERPPLPPGIGPVASALMELQRTAGNSAVLGIVSGRGAGAAARLGSSPPRRRLARRRTFSGLDLFSLLDDAAKSGDGALAAGFDRWWRQAWAYINDPKTPAERARRHLPPADPGDVTYLAMTGMKQADFLKAHPVKPFDAGDLATALGKAVEAFKRLPIDLRASKLVDALVAVYPELKITTTNVSGARVSSTKDKDNVKALATAAGKLFIAIASGSEDDSLREVFGDRNLAKAKKKYAAGEKMMNKLVKAGDVVVDRSGYRDESGIAGARSRAARSCSIPAPSTIRARSTRSGRCSTRACTPATRTSATRAT